MIWFVTLLTLILGTISAQSIAIVSPVSVTAEPAYVGAKSTSLTINLSTAVTLPYESQVVVTVPEEASIAFDVVNPRSNYSACGVTAGEVNNAGMRCGSTNSRTVVMVLPEAVVARAAI